MIVLLLTGGGGGGGVGEGYELPGSVVSLVDVVSV